MFWLLGASLSLANLPRHCASGLGALHGYTYDAVADILSIGDSAYSGAASAAISGVSYDNLHRLLGFTRPGTSQTVTCTYDAIGDMLTNSENGSAAYTYSTPSGTHLPHAVKTANGLNYTYDLCGNMLTRGSQALVYNPENRLIASAVSNQVTTFGYDVSGNRLWKQGAATNTLQVWIDGNYEEKDSKILFHVSAGDRMVYTYSPDGTVAEYYHPDHLHSAQVMSTTGGGLYQHYEYTAYGNSRYTSSTTAFPVSRRYTSQVLDEETGLYYYGARYYDPVLGRFIQPDTLIPNPFDPQSYDRYAYARDNPFVYVDPTGHAPSQWADAMQPAIDSYYGGYISDPTHTSVVGLYGAYMGQSVANGYNDMLRFGTGMEKGTLEGYAQDMGRGGGIILTVTSVAPKRAGAEAPAPETPAPNTVTRYMGKGEAEVVKSTGEIPNVGQNKLPRPTHVTTDTPLNSASKAQKVYELPEKPTHRATVPSEKAGALQPAPSGPKTSGGGSQNTVSKPIPVNPTQIIKLGD